MSNAVLNLKSKDARRAQRRWSFVAVIIHEDLTKVERPMPGIFFGTQEEAIALGKNMADKFRLSTPNVNVDVNLVPHETISIETRQQFEDLNRQAGLVMQACFLIAEQFRVETKVDKTAEELVQLALNQARDVMLMQMGGEAPKTEGEPTPSSIILPREDKSDRKRGIEAVNEALAAPAWVDAIPAEVSAEPFPDGEFGKEVA
jgi:hypothetical protein